MELSVVITAYDEGDLVRQAVDSVLAQEPEPGGTLPRTEVVLVHDQGADLETVRICEQVGQATSAVRVLENRRRKGVSGSRNTGIDAARGEWLAFLDGDDVWFPHAVATRWEALRQHRDLDFLAADFVRAPALENTPTGTAFTRANPQLRKLLGYPHGQDDGPFSDGSPIRLPRPVAEFCRASLCWTGTVMARRELVVRLGAFNERLRRDEDTHLWLRLAATSDFLFVPVPLALYRVRASTLARRGRSLRAWEILGTLDLLSRPIMRPWLGHLYRRRLVRMLNEQSAYLRRNRRFLAAAGYAAASGACWPVQARAWRCLAGSLARRDTGAERLTGPGIDGRIDG
jgi:glycosyltransferase involved in cell wall biosynthesis